MGKRGPPPKRPEIESAQGFPGRRKKKVKQQQVVEGAIQQQAADSTFVPPPPPAHLWRKSARAIWTELTSNPTTQLWFKRSDHNLIARYCLLEADFRSASKRNPKTTYTTTNTAGDRVIKRNPEHDVLMGMSRELRALEAQIGGTPVARMSLAQKMGTVGGGAPAKPQNGPGTPASPAQPAYGQPSSDAGTKPSPIGILKRAGDQPPPGSKPN